MLLTVYRTGPRQPPVFTFSSLDLTRSQLETDLDLGFLPSSITLLITLALMFGTRLEHINGTNGNFQVSKVGAWTAKRFDGFDQGSQLGFASLFIVPKFTLAPISISLSLITSPIYCAIQKSASGKALFFTTT